MTGWRAEIGLFAAFNIVLVALAGRLGWLGMLALDETGRRLAAALLSVAVAAAILAVNVWLIRRAVAAGLPKLGEMALWLIAGAQFVATIGFGRFSLVNLVLALV